MRVRTVSFDIKDTPTEGISKLINDSLPTLKPLQLVEITVARSPSGEHSVLLRSKKQNYFKNWQRRVKVCFDVDLEEEFVKSQHDSALRLSHPRHAEVVFQARPPLPTLSFHHSLRPAR